MLICRLLVAYFISNFLSDNLTQSVFLISITLKYQVKILSLDSSNKCKRRVTTTGSDFLFIYITT